MTGHGECTDVRVWHEDWGSIKCERFNSVEMLATLKGFGELAGLVSITSSDHPLERYNQAQGWLSDRGFVQECEDISTDNLGFACDFVNHNATLYGGHPVTVRVEIEGSTEFADLQVAVWPNGTREGLAVSTKSLSDILHEDPFEILHLHLVRPDVAF
jgi:hypothetical protein